MQTGRTGIRFLAVIAAHLAVGCGNEGISDPELPTRHTALVAVDTPRITRLDGRRPDPHARLRNLGDPVGAGSPSAPPPPRPIWVTAYYAAWQYSAMPPSSIDFGAITVLAHFAWHPTAAGGVDTTANGMTPAQMQAVTAATHAAGKKVVITVGGANAGAAWRAAIVPNQRAAYVAALVSAMSTYGYDGIDVDFEPMADSDAANFVPFIQALRAALPAGKLLTVATGWNAANFAPIVSLFDQFNLMTYDLAGPWGGWQTWHNSALHSNGLTFPSTGRLFPSCETRVDEAVAGGAPKSKLGFGIDFYGYVWNGATGPNQSISGVTVTANVPYSTLMDTYYSAAARRWHAGVEAPYLSLPNKFVSYDDEESIAKKIAWARAQGLGGVIIWELGGAGRYTGLLQAVKQAVSP